MTTIIKRTWTEDGVMHEQDISPEEFYKPRAVKLGSYDRLATLCHSEICTNGGVYLINGSPYCGKHAGRAALDILLAEGSSS